MRIPPLVWLMVAPVLFLETGCREKSPPVLVYKLGDKAQAGPLVYTVISSEWRTQMGSGEQVQIPTKRFLLIHLTVTNSSPEIISVPQTTLLDDSGQIHNESSAGVDAPTLLGLVRNVKPASALDGYVLFDVEPKSYKLKVEGGTSSSEVALVEIPLQFEIKRPDIPNAVQ